MTSRGAILGPLGAMRRGDTNHMMPSQHVYLCFAIVAVLLETFLCSVLLSLIPCVCAHCLGSSHEFYLIVVALCLGFLWRHCFHVLYLGFLLSFVRVGLLVAFARFGLAISHVARSSRDCPLVDSMSSSWDQLAVLGETFHQLWL